MRYAYSTITDLARDMADRLGLEVDAVTASLGEHRELWSLGGMPMRDLIATEHAVWADCTDGAEWPWSAEDAEQVAEEAEEAEEAERLEADPRASMRRLAADWEGEETLTQAIARAYNAPEEEVSVDTKTGDVWVGGGPGWLGDGFACGTTGCVVTFPVDSTLPRRRMLPASIVTPLSLIAW